VNQGEALEILHQVSEDTGVCWNEDSMLRILSDYISTGCKEDFESWARNRAQEENEECDNGGD
jgi:hypothetical protein